MLMRKQLIDLYVEHGNSLKAIWNYFFSPAHICYFLMFEGFLVDGVAAIAVFSTVFKDIFCAVSPGLCVDNFLAFI